MRRLYARVQGRVQGVGYRAFAQSEARRLGLCGYVRNCEDGTVEVVAEGEEGALQEFLNALQRGPVGAWVQRVDADYAEATGEWDNFTIRR
jgi:acylphosphatase